MMELHDYQKVAVEHLRTHPRAGLFLDMGLGKTAVACTALEPRHLPALVVAPKRVAEEVWPEELQKWRPDLSYTLAAGTKAQRLSALQSADEDVCIVSRDNLGDVPLGRFRTVIMDESSSFKNRGTQRWKTMSRIVKYAEYRWALTGTPSPNGLMDLWAQIFLLDDGQRLGKTLTGFRERYYTPGRQLRSGVITEWIPKPETEDAIHRLLEDICLSMSTDGRVKLPPVTINEVKVPLPDNVMKLYRKMRDNLVVDLGIIGGEIHSATNAAVLTAKLSQLTAGFMYVDDADLRDWKTSQIHSRKVEAVQEIIEGTGSPVLVFYRFRAERDALKAAIPLARDATERGIMAEWNQGKVPVMLAHPASAGHGLNLQHGGHTAVWTSASWSLEEDMQANKRLARQGQKHPVVIHYLVCPGTVDTSIIARVRDKQSVQDALLAHLEV